MAQRPSARSTTQAPRRNRRINEEGEGKLPDLARCPECDASYREGRWTWKAVPADAYEHVCPACVRIAEGYPAGVVHVAGGFVAQHRDDLVGLIRNVEQRERDEHPLKRIMGIDPEGAGFQVTVTDAKLALALGRALEKAYGGSLQSQPSKPDVNDLVRVHWARD